MVGEDHWGWTSSSVQQQSLGNLCCPMGHYAEEHGGPPWPVVSKGSPFLTPALPTSAAQALGTLCDSSDWCPHCLSLGELID